MAAATKKAPTSTLVVGSDLVTLGRGGSTAPAGTVHVVDGWVPVCGGDRVRFVFPGRDPETVEPTCADCSAAVVPRSTRRRAS
jgi:hypothetical protein